MPRIWTPVTVLVRVSSQYAIESEVGVVGAVSALLSNTLEASV